MKQLTFLIFTLFISILSYGQINFGLKGGANLANVKGFVTDGRKIRLGEYAGLLSEILIHKQLFIRPELLYSVKGYNFPALGNYNRGNLSLSYISLPILLGYQSTKKLKVLLGPEVSYLLEEKFKFSDGSTLYPGDFNKIDLGIDLGIAYPITKKLSSEFRYNYGFRDLVNVTFTDPYGSPVRKGKMGANRVLQIGLIYKLTTR
jgi:hypothetical protein